MREKYHTGTTLTTTQWIEVLHNPEITRPKDIALLQVMYSFEGHKAAASQIRLILDGQKAVAPLNSQMGHWGKRLVKEYPLKFTKREDGSERKWDLFFDGWTESRLFIWKIKNELVEALQQTGLTGEEQYPEEIPIDELTNLTEGLKRTIKVNTYERNPKARQKCIEHWKSVCSVCNFDFETKYGNLGKGFIHVHHLIPVSEIGKTYQVDPLNDLRPVCPNCHAMLHRTNPPLTIEELKTNIKYL